MFFVSASGGVGMILLIVFLVIASIAVILSVLLYYKRRVANLKTEILAVQYSADPQAFPDRHHFDNPVYAFQAPPDNTKLLNNFSNYQNQMTAAGSSNGGSRAGVYAMNINSDLSQKNFNADLTNPILYNGSSEGDSVIDHVYDEIKYKDECKDYGERRYKFT